MVTAYARPAAAAPRSAAWVTPYLVVAVVAAAGVLASTLYATARTWPGLAALDARLAALFVVLGGASFLILRNLLLFEWRGHRVALAPDEALVLVALLALPPPAVVLFPVPAMAAFQIATRRPFLKGAFNVATVVLAGAAGALTFVLARPLASPYVAAPAAIVVYTLFTHLMVSGVFALREGTPVHVVFGERFWVPTILHVALGIAGGVALVGLWRFHPAAIVALAPFAWLAREHVRLAARADREARAHKRLREATQGLVSERDVSRVATRVVQACADVFQAGRAELVLQEDGRERRFARDGDEGPRRGARPLAASLRAPDGHVTGALLVHPSSRTHESYGEQDAALLGVVAEEASAALASARALRDLDAARARLETLLATADDAVLVIGVDGVVRYANRAGRALFGLRQDATAIAGELFEDLGFLASAARGGAGGLVETHARSPERRFPAEVSAAAVKDADGSTVVLAIVRDVTSRKAAEEALLSQRVAQPLVRRIVRGLMDETGADALVLLRLGESLAQGVAAKEVAGFAKAYGEMGLGVLRAGPTDGARFEFEGENLLERARQARSTTCYLALGFLCGAVSRTTGRPARGTEVACASRGDHACRFVVHVRDEPPAATRVPPQG